MYIMSYKHRDMVHDILTNHHEVLLTASQKPFEYSLKPSDSGRLLKWPRVSYISSGVCQNCQIPWDLQSKILSSSSKLAWCGAGVQQHTVSLPSFFLLLFFLRLSHHQQQRETGDERDDMITWSAIVMVGVREDCPPSAIAPVRCSLCDHQNCQESAANETAKCNKR